MEDDDEEEGVLAIRVMSGRRGSVRRGWRAWTGGARKRTRRRWEMMERLLGCLMMLKLEWLGLSPASTTTTQASLGSLSVSVQKRN